MSQPLFFLNAFEFQWPINLTAQRRFWADSSGQERLMLTVKLPLPAFCLWWKEMVLSDWRDTTHASQSDFAFIFGPRMGTVFLTRSQADPVPQNRTFQRLVRAFFAKHLGPPSRPSQKKHPPSRPSPKQPAPDLPGESLTTVVSELASELILDTEQIPLDPVCAARDARVVLERWSENPRGPKPEPPNSSPNTAQENPPHPDPRPNS